MRMAYLGGIIHGWLVVGWSAIVAAVAAVLSVASLKIGAGLRSGGGDGGEEGECDDGGLHCELKVVVGGGCCLLL